MDHPARYALIELVNVHDPGLEFEAIHRVVFDVDADDLIKQAEAYYQKTGTPCRIAWHDDLTSTAAAAEQSGNAHAIPFVAAGRLVCLRLLTRS